MDEYINPFVVHPKMDLEIAKKKLKMWDFIYHIPNATTLIQDTLEKHFGENVFDAFRSNTRSIWNAVWESVSQRYREVVNEKMWNEIRTEFGDSVWSVYLVYISSLYPMIQEWKGVSPKPGRHPFQPGIDLWVGGYVPAFSGTIWHLFDSESVVYEVRSDTKQYLESL